MTDVNPEITIDQNDHALVDHLISYQPPRSDEIVAGLEQIREALRHVGHLVVSLAPRTPDRTVALRKIHDACMSSIAALVLNQEEI